jgi:predicted nucleic acid-binding protein
VRVFLDTCVFDWFLTDPNGPKLYAFIRSGVIEGFVFPEVATELYKVPDAKAEKRERLLALLRPLLPVRLTYVPTLGVMRLGTARADAPAGAAALREQLKRTFRFRKPDVVHLMNAHYAKCDVFLTNDREDILKRRPALEALLGIAILTPTELYERLCRRQS